MVIGRFVRLSALRWLPLVVMCAVVGGPGFAAPASAASSPKNTAIPVVTGTAAVGSALSTSTGDWTGTPAPTFTYQWQRCVVSGSCSNIPGAQQAAYVLTAADKDKQIRSKVIAKNLAGSQSMVSARTAAV